MMNEAVLESIFCYKCQIANLHTTLNEIYYVFLIPNQHFQGKPTFTLKTLPASKNSKKITSGVESKKLNPFWLFIVDSLEQACRTYARIKFSCGRQDVSKNVALIIDKNLFSVMTNLQKKSRRLFRGQNGQMTHQFCKA